MNWTEPEVYAARHKDAEIRAASRSGGIFTALSDEIFNEKGVVYGCILTEDFQAVHVRSEDTQTRNLMRGSKYIQSKLGDTYKNIKTDLITGRKVLFSGTSCQAAGLKEFLGKEYSNLYCMDIVCHGVPSTVVWKKYLLWQEEKKSGKIIFVNFRNKKHFGWREHIETLTMETGIRIHSKVFRNLFYGHYILRPSCYECPYKSIMHPGDITAADYWGIENVAPKLDDNKGVSLVLVNNEKGKNLFEKVKKNLLWLPARIEDSMQIPLIRPFEAPPEREQFWLDFYSMSFDKIAKNMAETESKRIYGKNFGQ